MVKSMFAAISGLQAHQSKMDVIGNNIANVNTWGYKTRSANFQDSMYMNMSTGSEGNTGDGGVGGSNTSQLGYGSNLGSITTNFSTGGRAFTGSGWNAMIDGTGFFIVGDMNNTPINATEIANSNLALSRVGIFSIDSNGYLVDSQSNYVYGYEVAADTGAVTTGDTIKPIKVPDDAAGNPQSILTLSIAKDGTLSGISDSGDKIYIGKLALASVENINGLEQSAGYLYDIGKNAGTVKSVETGSSGSGTGLILSNYLEMSNANLATDIADMITTQRGYQANSKVITVTDEMLEQLVNMKR